MLNYAYSVGAGGMAYFLEGALRCAERYPLMKHILIVEDNVGTTLLLERCFVERGFKVSVAHDGKTGLKIAEAYYPDLILLDLNLPGLPGEEVCRSIKHSYNRSLRDIPIIMITGKDSDVDSIAGRVLGAAEYLTKPIRMIEQISKVRYLLAA